MSSKELRRAGVLARVVSGELKLVNAAVMMGLSYRQSKRLGQRYREEGAEGLKHRSAGRESNRKKPKKFRERVLRLVGKKYSGEEGERFGPTFAGVAVPGKGPALSLNSGDNDGQEGHTTARAVTGPPTLSDSDPSRDVWNANSFYGERGSRPIVLGLPGEDVPTQGDYIFILNPSLPQPVLVRTQNIFDIATRDEWITTATGPGQGANVYLQGPPLQNPHQNINLGVVQASGGHAATVFYVGGDNTLWTWTEGAANWSQLVPALPILNRSVGANIAVRFFVSPYQPNLIYILDHDLFSGHVKRSDDGGQTWNIDTSLETQLTWNHQIAISSNDDQGGIGEHFDLVLTDMQFDPNNPLVRFAIGLGGVFLTIDGVNWTRLLHTAALSGRPSSCYYDWISDPFDPALYVSFAGRSLMKITDLLLSPIE